jgi:uncharacterized protein YbaP (TraB family)
MFFTVAALATAACQSSNSRSLLWKISNDKSSVYVQGVAHGGPKEFTQVSSLTEKIFKESGHIIIESMTHDPVAEYRTRSVELTKENQLILENFLNQLVIDNLITEAAAKEIKDHDPAYYQTALITALREHSLHTGTTISLFNQPNAGVDQTLADRALKLGKQVSALEQFFNQRTTWHRTCDVNKLFPKIVSSYKKLMYDENYLLRTHEIVKSIHASDLETTRRLISELEGTLDHFLFDANCSYYPRNIQWAENWNSLMERAPNGLVLVGAFHVTQEPSLITLLKNKGYRVEYLGAKKLLQQ